MFLVIFSIAVVELFNSKVMNSTAVRAMWFELESHFLDHYTIYYYPDPAQTGHTKGGSHEQMATFPAGKSSGVIGGLEEGQEYLFSIAAIILINGKIYEGQRTEPAPPG